MPNRYDYVAYDHDAQLKQMLFKKDFSSLSDLVDTWLSNGRARALIHTKLEEAYMWVGKAIRDEQITRNGSAPLQEERNVE